MRRKSALLIGVVALAVAAWLQAPGEAGAAKQAKQLSWKVQTCYECHETIARLHKMGKHVGLRCSACHSGLDKHVEEPGAATRPGTELSWTVCGGCHKPEFESFLKTARHRPGRDEKSQLTGRAPNPYWDKLMMGHGFTKEHATTRSHNWMLVDHLVVDRAYGGRFQPKEGWKYLTAPEGKKAWQYVEDKYPDVKEHKAFLPQTAAAANPVCLQCKTQDMILDWAYMGDPEPGAKWSRTSSVVDMAKQMQHGTNCFECHDPHAAKPRLARDGMIDALTRPEADTLWHKDPKRTKIEVIELGTRGFKRKIALMERYDSRLLCGQCHVEYNCNPGTDTKTGDRVTMADRRTNHFPYKDVFGLYDHYVNQIHFLDFKHALTGGMLWKAQHPESEAYYSSKHGKAGVLCDDCHMPKMKDPRTGKTYTSHFAVSPRVQLKEACLKCHKDMNEEKARYDIDSQKAYIRGKMRKAEFWLSSLIDKIVEAKKAGISEDAIKQAQDQHLRAHILWEFWTAENSDGYHNPEMARESLTRSVDESQKGIKILTEAMEGAAKR